MSRLCQRATRARLLFGFAGLFTIASIVLALAVSPWFSS